MPVEYTLDLITREGEDETYKLFGLNSPRGRVLKIIIFHMMLPCAVLQVARLHDPEKTNNHTNLVLKLCIKAIKPNDHQMESIHEQLQNIYEEIFKPVRNKLIAHNDLGTILEGKGFSIPDRKIYDYLKHLKDLVKLIEKHSDCKGNHQDYDYKKDTLDFVECLQEAN